MEYSDDELRSRCVSFWRRCFSQLEGELPELPQTVLHPVVDRLMARDCLSVLDLGCGYGRWSIALAREGFDVTAVDISPEALAILADTATERGLQIETVTESADRFCRADSFDAALCVSVLDHMPFEWAERATRNIRMSLKSNGLLYATFDHVDPEEQTADIAELSDGTLFHTAGEMEGLLWRFYADDELRRLFSDFELQSLETTESGSRRIWALPA